MDSMAPTHPLTSWDIVAVVVYFVLVLAAGFYAMYRSNRGTVSGYFLAGRHMTWLPVGASLFASNIGSEHFIGLAGSGAAAGIGVGMFEISAVIFLQLLGWVFLPVYIASKVSTLPEYMSKRFGGQRIRIFLALLSLVLYIFTKISVNMYSGAIFIKQTLGWNLYLSVLLLLAMTAVCTVTGGLAAVIYMDTLQCAVMLIGSLILMAKGFYTIGGLEGLMMQYSQAIPTLRQANSTCGLPREDSWQMLRDPFNSDIPWLGFILGQFFASSWYWCADQMMVQRALSAKSLSHAQGATLLTGYIKFLPFFIMVLPGMISRVLYTDIVACALPEECERYCGSRVSCTNLAYPLLILRLLPAGLRGILMAVMLAALMSDLTSVFNSASTLFTIDIWRHIRKKAGAKELLLVGKLFILVMIVISIIWIPVILQMQGGQLFLYIQSISSYLAPPIATVYYMALFWRRFNEKGAFWGLIAGFAVGITRMILDFVYPEPSCGEPDLRPTVVSKVHFMYFAFILAIITAGTGAIVSLITDPPESFRLIRTLYFTRFDSSPRDDDKQNLELTTAIKSPPVTSKNGTSDSRLELTRTSTLNINASTETVQKELPSEEPLLRRFWSWFCGYRSTASNEDPDAMEKHLIQISSLHQNPRTKKILFINVIIILIINFSTYFFFTFGTPALEKSFRSSNTTIHYSL